MADGGKWVGGYWVPDKTGTGAKPTTTSTTPSTGTALGPKAPAPKSLTSGTVQSAIYNSEPRYTSIFDRFWTDDLGRNISDVADIYTPDDIQKGSFLPTGMRQGWQDNVGDKINATTTGITTMYDTVNWGVSGVMLASNPKYWQNRGKNDNLWQTATEVSAGQAFAAAVSPLQDALGESLGMGKQGIYAGWDEFDIADKYQRDLIFAAGTASSVGSGIADATVSWFLDPLVVAGKAAKVARFGTEAFGGFAGVSARSTNSRLVTESIDGALDDALEYAATGGASGRENFLNVIGRNAAKMNDGELREQPWIQTSTQKDAMSGIFNNIDDERTAIIAVAAGTGNVRAINMLRTESAAVHDAMASLSRYDAYERAWYQPGYGMFKAPLFDDVLEMNQSGRAILDDLIKRDNALADMLGVLEKEDSPIRMIGGTNTTGMKIAAAWRAGRANRDIVNAGKAMKGKEGPLAEAATDAKTWMNREPRWAPAAAQERIDRAVAEGRITAARGEEMKRAATGMSEGVPASSSRIPTSAPGVYEAVFQLSSNFRKVGVWNWINGQRGSGWLAIRGVDDGYSSDEWVASLSDSKVLRKDKEFIRSMVSEWNAGVHATDRMPLAAKIEMAAVAKIAGYYGVKPEAALAAYKIVSRSRQGSIDMFRAREGHAYAVDDTGKIIALHPQMRSQLETHVPVLDFRVMEHTISRMAKPQYRTEVQNYLADMGDVLRMDESRLHSVDMFLEELNSFWKATVLFRLGYPVRNTAEGWLRTAAVLGTIPALAPARVAKGIGRVVYTNPRNARRREEITKYEGIVADNLHNNRLMADEVDREINALMHGPNAADAALALDSQASTFEGIASGAAAGSREAARAARRGAVYRLRAGVARGDLSAYARAGVSSVSLPVVGKVRAVARFSPTKEAAAIMRKGGITPTRIIEVDPRDAAKFHEAIGRAKARPNGSSVYQYEVGEYAEMRLFLTDDGSSGFALKGDDIVSVFKGDTALESVADSLVPLALQEGGRTADAFDTVLPHIYGDHGLAVKSRIPWNDGEAPGDWNKADYAKFNGGEPDIVFMQRDAGMARPYQPGEGYWTASYGAAVNAQLRGAAKSPELEAALRHRDEIRASQDALTEVMSQLADAKKAAAKKFIGSEPGGAFTGDLGDLRRALANNDATQRNFFSAKGARDAQVQMNNKAWTAVKPEDPQYWGELNAAVNQLRLDPLGRQAIKGATPEQMSQWLRTAEGKAYARDMGLRYRDERLRRVAMLHDLVERYLPSDEARLLADSEMLPSPEEFRGLLAGRPDLSPVHGRQVAEMMASSENPYRAFTQFIFKWIGNKPDSALVRQPFYNEVWKRETKSLWDKAKAQGYDDLTDAERLAWDRRIEEAAHRRALKATNDTLFTLTRYSNPAALFKFVSPFFAAWENSTRTWLKIIANDPSVLARGMILWDMPNQLGLVVDKDGNKVESDRLGFLTGSENQYVIMPKLFNDWIMERNGGVPLKMAKGGFNVVSPGETPALPGFGPAVVAPVGMWLANKPDTQEFLKRALGEKVYNQFAPFGNASGDWLDTVASPAARKAFIMWQGQDNADYLAVQASITQTAVADWLLSGGDLKDMPKPEDIAARTDAFWRMSWLASVTLPVSTTRMSKYQPQIDYWNSLKADPTMSFDEKIAAFEAKYPSERNAYNTFTQSTSRGQSKDIDPTIEAWSAITDHPTQAANLSALDPKALGILGATAATGKFSPGVFQYWLTNTQPGTTDTYKEKALPADIINEALVSQMWDEYNAEKAQMEAALTRLGVKTWDSKTAQQAGITQMWVEFQQGTDGKGGMVGKYGTAWTVYGPQAFRDDMPIYLSGVTTLLNDKSFMASDLGRSKVWQDIQTYMVEREAAKRARDRVGLTDEAKDAIDELWVQFQQDHRLSSLGFSDFFDSYLAQDDLTVEVPGLEVTSGRD